MSVCEGVLMTLLSEFRRHDSENYAGLPQMRCVRAHTLGSVCCGYAALCQTPAQAALAFEHGFYPASPTPMLLLFLFFNTSFLLSVGHATYFCYHFKNPSWSIQAPAHFSPFLYSKIPGSSCLHRPCHLRFSPDLLNI